MHKSTPHAVRAIARQEVPACLGTVRDGGGRNDMREVAIVRRLGTIG